MLLFCTKMSVLKCDEISMNPLILLNIRAFCTTIVVTISVIMPFFRHTVFLWTIFAWCANPVFMGIPGLFEHIIISYERRTRLYNLIIP